MFNWEHAKGILVVFGIALCCLFRVRAIDPYNLREMKHAVISTIFAVVEELAILKNLPLPVQSSRNCRINQ